MKIRKLLNPVIANALIWAAIIIAASLLTGDSEQGNTLMLLLLAGWFATQSLITGSPETRRAECAAFRRLLRRNPR